MKMMESVKTQMAVSTANVSTIIAVKTVKITGIGARRKRTNL